METAHKGLGASIREIAVMPALADREHGKPWSLNEDDEEGGSYRSWILKHPGPREKSMKDRDFVLMWLTLKGMDNIEEAKRVREVFIVSQGQFLQSLLGKGKYLFA